MDVHHTRNVFFGTSTVLQMDVPHTRNVFPMDVHGFSGGRPPRKPSFGADVHPKYVTGVGDVHPKNRGCPKKYVTGVVDVHPGKMDVPSDF